MAFDMKAGTGFFFYKNKQIFPRLTVLNFWANSASNCSSFVLISISGLN